MAGSGVYVVEAEPRTTTIPADGEHVAPTDRYLLVEGRLPILTQAGENILTQSGERLLTQPGGQLLDESGNPLEFEWAYRSRRLVILAESRTLEVPSDRT